MAALVGWGVLGFAAPSAAQLPTGGTVVGGQATITTGANQVTVRQATNRGVIDWQTFSIGANGRVDFQQPGASSVTLNRVVGPDPSVIAGQLTANGQIVLVNGAGVLFANGAQVNVGSLVASTANISNPQRFMAGGPVAFDVPSPNANAGVVNAGTITVREGGLVGLVGHSVSNSGMINARLGRVTLGGAETFTVDLAGDGLINFQIGQPVRRQPVDGAGGKVALVSNTGAINADGGVVTMTARAAGSVVDSVVNVGGAIRAQAVSQEGGVLILDGGDGGTVNVSGKLDVSGKGPGQRGGQVVATAKGGKVTVASTGVIDASGVSGGGRVNIGGSYQGKGPIANARDTKVAAGAKITVDATGQGNGGTVIVWSDNATVFGGSISARGGPQGGDGGFVEVSGKNYLDYRGVTDLRAPLGTSGTLLLDPDSLLIRADTPDLDGTGTGVDLTSPTLGAGEFAGINSIITAGAVANQLALGNVSLAATGNITVQSAITWSAPTTLTLNAGGDVTVTAPITATGNGNLTLIGTGPGGIGATDPGTINLGSGTLILQGTSVLFQNTSSITAGLVDVTASGSVSLIALNNNISTVRGTGSSVNIITQGALTVLPAGVTATTLGVTLQVGGDVTVNGPVAGGSLGGVTITAAGQMLVNSTITSTSTSGSVSLQSTGGSVTVSSGGGVSSATFINVNAATQILVDGTISAPGDVALTSSTGGATVNGTVESTSGGAVTLTTDGPIVVNGSVTSTGTSGIVNLQSNGTSAGSITVGSTGSISADQNVSLGTTGQIVVDGSISHTGDFGSVNLVAGGADANGVGILLRAGSTISSSSTDTFAAAINLDATTGSIVQTGGSILANTATGLGRLDADAAGSISLASPTNDVNVVTGTAGTDFRVGASFRYVDANTVTLGFDTGEGTIDIQIGQGGYVDIAANVIQFANGVLIGQFNDSGSLADNPTGVTVLRPTTAGTAMVIGGSGGTTLTETALVEGIRTGTLRVGSIGRAADTVLGGATTAAESAAGPITVQGLNFFVSPVLTLVLESGAGGIAISQTGPIQANALATAVVGSGSVQLTNVFNSVDALAHIARLDDTVLGMQSGTYQFTGNSTVTVAPVGLAASPLVGLRDGIVTTGGAITLVSTASLSITVNSPIISGGADVTLTAVGPITNTAAGSIDTGVGTLTLSGTSINLNAAPVTAGVVNFTATNGNVNIINPGNAISALASAPSSAAGSEGGDVIVTSTVSMTVAPGGIIAPGFMILSSSGQLTVNGGVTAGEFVALQGVTGFLQTGGTISAPQILLAAGPGASVVQTGGNILSPSGVLGVSAGAAVDMSRATNDVATIFGAAGTDFRYVGANLVTLGFSNGMMTQGITIGAGRSLDVSANSITFLPGALIGGIADSSGGALDNPTGVTVLRPTTAGSSMLIGGTSGTTLTEAALIAGVRTGTLRIGSIGRGAGTVLGGSTIASESAAGPITVQGLDLTVSGTTIQNLVLESAATGTAISQTAAIRLSGGLATAVLGSGSVELTDAGNSVAVLAHIARLSDTTLGTQTGTYRFVSGDTVTVASVGGVNAPLLGLRDSGNTAGLPANAAVVTSGGDVTLVSQASDTIVIQNALVATNATVRLRSAGDITQSATGGIVASGLLATSVFGSVDLTAGGAINNVQNLAGSAAGDFRLINSATLMVPASGVAGDDRVATIVGVHAGQLVSSGGSPGTLELAIASGDIVANAPLTSPRGLVLLRRVAGATGSDIILNGTSFDIGAGPPNLVVLDLTGSSALSPSNFAALMTSITPPSGTSPIAAGPNVDGTIILNGVNAPDTTMYLVGGTGSTIGGSGTFGLLGVYVPHVNPIALTGSVRQIAPTVPHSVAAPFSEPFDATTFAGFYVRRSGAVVNFQTFNTCPIASGICPVPPRHNIPPVVDWWPNPHDGGVPIDTATPIRIDTVVDRGAPTPLNLSTIILVNQGNEYLFNVDEETRKARAVRGGK